MPEHTNKPSGELPIETDFRLQSERAYVLKKTVPQTAPETGSAPGKSARRRKDSAKLVWDSKPRRAPNPKDIEFQTAEVVIPNPATAGRLPLSFRAGLDGEAELDKQKMNRLIWGDNLLVMQALLASGYESKIDLIYIDPPFASSEDYHFSLSIGGEEFTKQPSIVERLAYTDIWAGGMDSYLEMLYPRLQLMRRLLADTGSIYVHLDWHVIFYVKAILDEIFGPERFLNEVIWKRQTAKGDVTQGARHMGRIHESILLYTKTENYSWNMQYTPYDKEYVESAYRNQDSDGRRYTLSDITAPGGAKASKGNPHYEFLGVTRYWRFSKESMQRLHKEGRIVQASPGAVPRQKRYLDEMPGVPLQDLWLDIRPVQGQSNETLGYSTQKPGTLLDRIIRLSSSENDLVADFFCGSGTTAAVAEKLNRRWITNDFGKVAIQVARARFVEIGARPFLIENIGNYQRETIYLSGGRIGEMQRIVLKLYGATPHPQHRELGTKQGADLQHELVFVGYPDRPVTARKAEELARFAGKLDGTGYKRLVLLGWDYDYNYSTELENRLKHSKPQIKTKIESRTIPPEIYDCLKTAKDEADLEKLAAKVRFHEKPYLKLKAPKIRALEKGKVEIAIGLERYVLFDFPIEDEAQRGELLRLVKANFAVLIDYLAVDWDYDGATFKSAWQAIRGNGRRICIVPTGATATLPKGKRTIAVRVVDVFGNDASATLTVEGN